MSGEEIMRSKPEKTIQSMVKNKINSYFQVGRDGHVYVFIIWSDPVKEHGIVKRGIPSGFKAEEGTVFSREIKVLPWEESQRLHRGIIIIIFTLRG